MSNQLTTPPQNFLQEDEIDLRELFQTILKGKKTIAIVTAVIVLITLIHALKTPNEYKSQTILIPTAEESGGGLGGLGGLAAMAGVSVGGAAMTPDIAFSSLLNNYTFMKEFVYKNKIYEHYSDINLDEKYVFALGFRDIYDIFKSNPDTDTEINYDDEVYKLIKSIQTKFSISADKKSGLITVSYMDKDRTYPAKIIDAFLKDASTFLVKNNLRIVNNKLSYFEKELLVVDSFELRQSISLIVSKIVEEKVMMKSKEYYQCDVLTYASEAYIKDKSKPKRGLILVVSFVTSIILGIFLVFFLEFIKKEEE